jgi:phosphoribosyl 1,2-cyclic phosphate phosphodiesterase
MTGLKVTVLGCGGSLGVPVVGGFWGACDPANPRNRRRRPSILVEQGGAVVLVDTGPDLRAQLLDAEVKQLDGVLYTHGHADHIHGIDDVRPFLFARKAPVPAYLSAELLRELEVRFPYALTTVAMERGLYDPFLDPSIIDGPFSVSGVEVLPFVQDHGFGPSFGFRFGSIAYSTDVAMLDEAAFAALEGVETWIVDATREQPLASHAHLERTLEWIERVRPDRAFLTHMSAFMDYDTLCAKLPSHVRPCHDGLVIEG